MSRLLVLWRREFLAQLLSPTSWVLVTLLWLISGILYRNTIIPSSGGDLLRMTWMGGLQALWLQLIVVPLQTMRLISEEKRTGTFEMLVTTPARDHEIVLAKFAAAWMFNAAMWLIIPLYALVASKSGGDPDMGPVWVSYLSVVATGALYLSIGLMASAVTRHQILAAFLAFVLLFLLGLAPSMWNQLPESWDTIRTVLRKGDILLQMEQAARGLLDVVHLTYKLAFAGLFLLFTTRILELRKWA